MMSLDPALIAKLEPLEVRARRVVEGHVAGRHESPFRGFSIEFAEHRDYAPGDDLRYLDWKLHAKTDRFHLKQFEEETNFAAHLLLDVSESMSYRSESSAWSKLECGKTLAAATAHLVIRQRDAAGLALFDREARSLLPPSSKATHLKEIFRTLESARAGADTAVGPILHDLASRVTRRGLVIVFSDLFDDPSSVLRGLRHLAHRRHDVRIAQLVDPAEIEFPFDEPTRFLGMEGLPDLTVDTSGLRRAYRDEFESQRRTIESGCRDMGASYRLVRTDEPPDRVLAELLSAPRGRR
ncbi:MAG: DUF58 domain-containing protein [Planctomycetota bacterium]|nr:DUF58 domain-containing protein [Planctomycetaceae bacterium]MDQ3330260.1 DUF58 domain-containing protein [Planctomycetota bacterium]